MVVEEMRRNAPGAVSQFLQKAGAEMTKVLFRNATVFDGCADEAIPGMEVLVADGRIEAVSEQSIKAEGATIVDVAGQTLMPGLIDAHVHVFAVNLVASRNENMPLTLMTARAV